MSATATVLAGVLTIGGMGSIPVDNIEQKIQATEQMAYYRHYDLGNIYDEYFAQIGNTFNYMGEDSSIQLNEFAGLGKKKVESWLNNFIIMVNNEDIGFGEWYKYFDFLYLLRKENAYSLFLNELNKSKNISIKCAIALALSQKDFAYISADEENLILELLSSSNIQVQEYALNALLMWDEISDINSVKNLQLGNKFLREDLKEFIEEHT